MIELGIIAQTTTAVGGSELDKFVNALGSGIALVGLVVVMTAGTFVFHVVEGKNLLNSVYFTIITLSTVG